MVSGGSSKPVLPTSPKVQPQIPQTGGSGDQTWNGRKLRLVVDDTFDSRLDTSIWEHEVSLWGGGVSIPLYMLLMNLHSLYFQNPWQFIFP